MIQNSRLVELAIKGLEAEKARIEQELMELRNQRTPRTATNRAPVAAQQEPQLQAPAAKPRRKMSAAARKKISQAMKRRHAERKAAALKK